MEEVYRAETKIVNVRWSGVAAMWCQAVSWRDANNREALATASMIEFARGAVGFVVIDVDGANDVVGANDALFHRASEEP